MDAHSTGHIDGNCLIHLPLPTYPCPPVGLDDLLDIKVIITQFYTSISKTPQKSKVALFQA